MALTLSLGDINTAMPAFDRLLRSTVILAAKRYELLVFKRELDAENTLFESIARQLAVKYGVPASSKVGKVKFPKTQSEYITLATTTVSLKSSLIDLASMPGVVVSPADLLLLNPLLKK